MKAFINYFFFIVITLLFSGCYTQTLYDTPTANIPLFEETGDLEIAAHSGTSSLDANLAYTIDTNFGIVVNANHIGRSGDTFNVRRQNYGEMAIAYVFPHDMVTKRIYRGKGLFNLSATRYNNTVNCYRNRSIMAGYGMGWSLSSNYKNSFWDDIDDPKDSFFSEGNYSKLFLQYNNTLEYDWYKTHLGLRVAYLQFLNIRTDINETLARRPNNDAILLELFMGHSVEIGPMELMYTLGFLVRNDTEREFSINPLLLNLGLKYTLPGNLLNFN